MENQHLDYETTARRLKDGDVGVMPTDTVYGLVCSAFKKRAVERMYKIAKRDKNKPFVVLIANKGELSLFGIKSTDFSKKIISKAWPGKVSIIFSCDSNYFKHLHRGRYSIAFRLPDDDNLRLFLKKSGPLATTSANPQNEITASTIAQAKRYFYGQADFFVDGGKHEVVPSTIIMINRRGVELVREGVQDFDSLYSQINRK